MSAPWRNKLRPRSARSGRGFYRKLTGRNPVVSTVEIEKMNATEFYAKRAIARYEAIQGMADEADMGRTAGWPMEAWVGWAMAALVAEVLFIGYSMVPALAGW
jgi:hypothetical protein